MFDGLVYGFRIEHRIMKILHDVKIIGRGKKCVSWTYWMVLLLLSS